MSKQLFFIIRAFVVSIVAFLFLSSGGCLYTPKHYTWYKDYTGIKRIRYAVQAGAFSDVENAAALTEKLIKEDVEAFYFRDDSGLYKVRFGDYPTEKLARLHADRLRKWRIMDDYYIIGPDEFAVAQEEKKGGGSLRDEIVRTARRYLNIPYRWGGESPEEGFDCSGLTMAVYEYNGLKIPRTSRSQFRSGQPVSKDDLVRGDLVFFATGRSDRISHVGVYIGSGKFIHAPGRGKTIRTDSLSNSYYSRTYAGARSYL